MNIEKCIIKSKPEPVCARKRVRAMTGSEIGLFKSRFILPVNITKIYDHFILCQYEDTIRMLKS